MVTQELLHLIDAIAEDHKLGEDAMVRVSELKKLIRRITETNSPTQVIANYNGREFSYEVKQTNLRAAEYVPRKRA
jgi:hypothetical protein